MFIAPPQPGFAQVRCSCCKACTNRPCAMRSCSDFMMPPSNLSLRHFCVLLSEDGLKCPLTARIKRPSSSQMILPSLLVSLSQEWHPCWSHCGRPLHPYLFLKGSLVDPRLRASNEHLLSVRVPRAGGRPGYPSYPPCPADLDIRAVHVPRFVAEEVAHRSHGVVYRADVSGWDAFCHAGEFFRRRAA